MGTGKGKVLGFEILEENTGKIVDLNNQKPKDPITHEYDIWDGEGQPTMVISPLDGGKPRDPKWWDDKTGTHIPEVEEFPFKALKETMKVTWKGVAFQVLSCANVRKQKEYLSRQSPTDRAHGLKGGVERGLTKLAAD